MIIIAERIYNIIGDDAYVVTISVMTLGCISCDIDNSNSIELYW